MQRADLNAPVHYIKFSVGEADLTDTDTSQNVTLFTLPQGGKILGVHVKESTIFAAPAASALTVSVGTASSTTAYTSAFSLMQVVADTTFQETTEFKSATHSATAVVAVFTATGGNLNTFTTGQVDIYIAYLDVLTPSA